MKTFDDAAKEGLAKAAMRPVPLGVPGAPRHVSRREAMQWVAAALAVAAMPISEAAAGKAAQFDTALPPPTDPNAPRGYGVDADLIKLYEPGSFWPLTFTDAHRQTAKALADVILPADAYGPAASELGVVAIIDEWVSSPYPHTQADRPVILEGLDWLAAESHKRFGKPFDQLAAAQHRAICDDICYIKKATKEFKKPAHFFSRFRSIAAGAYFATPEGWKAIGYVGNVALPSFDGPPPEVLERLGVSQTIG